MYKRSPASMGKEEFNAEYEAFGESISEFSAWSTKIKKPISQSKKVVKFTTKHKIIIY
jgi:hypothetical protein